MGLEMFSMHNKVVTELRLSTSRMRETEKRLGAGALLLLVYIAVGAVVFCQLEAPRERAAKKGFVDFTQAWMDQLTKAGFDEEDILRLLSNVRDAVEGGVWWEGNATDAEGDSRWTFGRSFFFSGALITTVGYGRMWPRTEQGRLFLIIYCLIGIPLSLAFLSAIVARLRHVTSWLRVCMNNRLGHLFRAPQIQIFHLLTIGGFIVVFAFLLPAAIFEKIEPDWTYLDGFFYCFVSLTTIGLGEQEPGDHPEQPARPLYKILTTVYLLAGLACMMLLLATIYDMPQMGLTQWFLATDDSQAPSGEDDDDDEDTNAATEVTRIKTGATNAQYASQQWENGSLAESPHQTNHHHHHTQPPPSHIASSTNPFTAEW